MKAFQMVQANYAILNITAYQSIQPQPYNSGKILLAFSMFGSLLILQLVYIFYVANTFDEYVECAITTSGKLVICVFLATVIFKMPTMFEFFDTVEEVKSMSE